MKTRSGLVRLLVAVSILASLAAAQEARRLNRIPRPEAKATPALPPGARAVKSIRPVAAARVEAIVREIASAWNTPRLGPLLAANFYDKSRLLDTLQTKVPRDARLRVLGIQGIQTLGQYLQKAKDGQEQLVSRVSVTVRTQLEYNDPKTGFQRLEGTNEYILLVTEPA